MSRIVWTFGLIAGGIMAAVMVISQFFRDRIGFGLEGMVIGYTGMVLGFLMVYFGVRSYRDNVANGSVGFGRALGVGLLIAFIGAACYVATWEVIYFKFSPDFGDKYAAAMVEQAKKSGATDAQIAAKLKAAAEFKEMYRNPFVNIAFTFLEPLPVGLPFAFLAAFLVSRKRKTPGAALAQ